MLWLQAVESSQTDGHKGIRAVILVGASSSRGLSIISMGGGHTESQSCLRFRLATAAIHCAQHKQTRRVRQSGETQRLGVE
jgi:hypothetical protein